MDGVIVVDKECGYTSRDVVNIVGKILGTKKIGHTGTLDPMATGVLVIVVGKATKLVEHLTSLKKEYLAGVLLGKDTDTLDITGTVLKEEFPKVTKKEVQTVLKEMTKTYLQEVPKYSAVKVNGKKLYEYARRNEVVILPKKEVTIYQLELLNFDTTKGKQPTFQFQTSVSKGTYIRSLIRDIGTKLNTVAVMTSLRRMKQGRFTLEDAVTLEQLKAGNYTLIPISKLVEGIFEVQITEAMEKYIRNGNKIKNEYDHERVVFKKGEEVIAIYQTSKKDNQVLRPEIMF